MIFKLPDEVDGQSVIGQLGNVHRTPFPEGWMGGGLPISFVCGEGISKEMQKEYLEIITSVGSLYRNDGRMFLVYMNS